MNGLGCSGRGLPALVACLYLITPAACRKELVYTGAYSEPNGPGDPGPGGASVPSGSAGAGGGMAGATPPPMAGSAPPDTRPGGSGGGGRGGTAGVPPGTGGVGGAAGAGPTPIPADAAVDVDPSPPADAAPAARQALLVVGQAQLIATDSAVLARLRARLMDVQVLPEADGDAEDAAGKALVVITSSASTAGTSSKFRDVTVPVILLEPNLMGLMRMTADPATAHGATDRTETEVDLIDATHPLAAGLSGAVRVYQNPWRLTWGIPASGAIRVATVVDDPTRTVIFAYPAGAPLVTGTAPAKRVAFFLHDNPTANLTPQAESLLDAAIDWSTAP